MSRNVSALYRNAHPEDSFDHFEEQREQTSKGLTIPADLHVNSYGQGIKISEEEMARWNITPGRFSWGMELLDSPEKQRESQNIVVLGYLRAGP
jgi:hypothetical protein